MNPETARAQLHAAGAAAGAPPSDLAATVLTTRRRRRQHTLALSGAAMAVLLVAVGVPAVLAGLQGAPAGSAAAGGGGPVYTLDTRGSLPDERALVNGLQQLPWAPTTTTGSTYRSYDAGNPTASSGYYVATDLAATIPTDQRHVVWVDDVPGGRWALLAIPTDGGYAAAWFTGLPGADASQMHISGPVQLVAENEPMAHIDLANPDKTLVVVAAPGDSVSISPNVTLQADGSTTQDYYELPADDGVAVTTVDTAVRYGVPATVQVSNPSGTWQARPTAAGAVAGVAWGSSFGWDDSDPEIPSIQLTRGTSGLDVGRELSDTMLSSLFGPTGLTLREINDSGPQIEQMFSGTRDGSLPDPFSGDPTAESDSQAPIVEPSIAIWDVELPSGAHAVMAGWARFTDDGDGAEVTDHEQTLLTLRGPDFDPTTDLIATPMVLPESDARPTETVIVIAGSPDGATARLLDADGNEVGRAAMTSGTATAPAPPNLVTSVEVLDGDGAVLQTSALALGITDLAPDGEQATFLTDPIPARLPVATPTATADPTPTDAPQTSENPAADPPRQTADTAPSTDPSVDSTTPPADNTGATPSNNE